MNKLTKTIAILMVLAIITSFAGCDVSLNGSDNANANKALSATEIYKKAIEKDKDTKTGDISMKMDIDMSYSGGTNQMSMDLNMKTDQTDTGNIKMAMSGNMNIPMVGETAINYTFIDNVIYVETAGMKYKSPVDVDTAKKMIGDSNTEDMFGIESFKTVEITEDGTNKLINFTCEPDQLNSFLKKYIDQYSTITTETKIDDLVGSFVIDEDYNIKSMNMTIGMESTSEGNAIKMDIKVEIKVNSLNQPVEITAPADAASYVDVDPSAITANQAA